MHDFIRVILVHKLEGTHGHARFLVSTVVPCPTAGSLKAVYQTWLGLLLTPSDMCEYLYTYL